MAQPKVRRSRSEQGCRSLDRPPSPVVVMAQAGEVPVAVGDLARGLAIEMAAPAAANDANGGGKAKGKSVKFS